MFMEMSALPYLPTFHCRTPISDNIYNVLEPFKYYQLHTVTVKLLGKIVITCLFKEVPIYSKELRIQ